jgi:thioredoxin 1
MFGIFAGVKDFEDQVMDTSGMVLVNFWAWWSAECGRMSTVMRKVTDLLEVKDAIVHLDWDHHRELARELKVFGVPTLLIYMNGNEVGRHSGTMSENDLMRRIVEAKNCDASPVLQ